MLRHQLRFDDFHLWVQPRHFRKCFKRCNAEGCRPDFGFSGARMRRHGTIAARSIIRGEVPCLAIRARSTIAIAARSTIRGAVPCLTIRARSSIAIVARSSIAIAARSTIRGAVLCLAIIGEDKPPQPFAPAICKRNGDHVNCALAIIPAIEPPGHAVLDL